MIKTVYVGIIKNALVSPATTNVNAELKSNTRVFTKYKHFTHWEIWLQTFLQRFNSDLICILLQFVGSQMDDIGLNVGS